MTDTVPDVAASTLLNLTPHPVDIVMGDRVVTVQPEPVTCRIEIVRQPQAPLQTENGPVDAFLVTNGETVDLPPARPGVVLIVSRMVADANPDRADLVFPLDLIRDETGRIIGCGSLGRICPA